MRSNVTHVGSSDVRYRRHGSPPLCWRPPTVFATFTSSHIAQFLLATVEGAFGVGAVRRTEAYRALATVREPFPRSPHTLVFEP